jgi:hypothetical protein
MATPKEWFHADDVIDRRSVAGRLTTLFDIETIGQVRNTMLLLVVPLTLLSAAALHDGHFYRRTLTLSHPEYGDVLGMSFLGDTMVWPFCFLVPLLIVLSAIAARSTAQSLNRLTGIIDNAVDDKAAIQRDVQKTIETFGGGKDRIRILVLLLPWFLAISFNLYNGLTCYFRPELATSLPPYVIKQLPELVDPYATTKIFVRDGAVEPALYKPVDAHEKVSIPKWDTDRKNAFASTMVTRVWALFFYSVLPFMGIQLVLMVCGFAYFLRIFERWVRESNTFKLEDSIISPFSSIFGGLDYLSRTAMSMFYVVLCLGVIAGLAFLKEGISVAIHDVWVMAIFFPAALLVFLLPMYYAHAILKTIKTKYLTSIGSQQNLVLYRLTADRFEDREFSFVYYKFLSLKAYRDEIAKMSVWPFSNLTIIKVVAFAFSVPTITAVLSLISNYPTINTILSRLGLA